MSYLTSVVKFTAFVALISLLIALGYINRDFISMFLNHSANIKRGINGIIIKQNITNMIDSETMNITFLNATHSSIYSSVTLCIGVQRGGTLSLKKELESYKDEHIKRFIKHEYHYWDQDHHLNSFEEAVQSCEETLDERTYINKIVGIESSNDTQSLLMDSYFAKTPSDIIYPHIAYMLMHKVVKHGTKLFVLLRYPTNRFASCYWHNLYHEKKIGFFHHENETIADYLDKTYNDSQHGHNTFYQFNTDLNDLYQQYTASDSAEHKNLILIKLLDRYKDLLYYYANQYIDVNNFKESKALFQYYLVWIRSCNAPQIVAYIYYLNQIKTEAAPGYQYKYGNQFKIVQSEQLYDPVTFSKTMKRLICFIQYDWAASDFYTEWMEQCIASKQNKVYEAYHTHGEITKNKENVSTQAMIEKAEESLAVCNKWIKLLLSSDYHQYILGTWDWTLWP